MFKKIPLILLLFLFTAPVSASAQMLIEQGKTKITAKPGETTSGFITVHNTSENPLNLRAYWEDFTYVPPFDGSKRFMPRGTGERSLSQSISFLPEHLEIPAFGKQDIKYTVHIPPDAAGGYYGVLFVEKGGGKVQGTGVEIVTRLGSLFFVETKNRSKKAAVSDIALTGNTLKATFTNQGNVILIPKGIYYAMDQEGIIAARGEVAPFYLPPSAKTDFQIKLPELPSGRYTVVTTFDLEDGESLVQETGIVSNGHGKFTLQDASK